MKSIIEEASSIVKAIEAAWIRAEKPQEFSVKIFEEPEKNFFGMVTKSAKIALIFNPVEKRQPKEVGSKHKTSTESTLFNTQTKEYRKEPRRETAPREPREEREYQERREPRERGERREPREQREPRERQDRHETREPRERYERQEPRERREPRERNERQEAREQHQEHREPRERNERREPREPREPREYREPMTRELTRKETPPRPAPAREQEQLSFVAQETGSAGEQQHAAPEKIFWTEEMISTTRAWVETLLKNMNCSDITFNLEPKRYYLTITFDKPVCPTKALEQQLFRGSAYLIMQMLRTKMKKQYRGLKVVLSSPAPAEPVA